MVVGLLGNESPDLNRFILVNPKSENDVRLQAKLGSKNPTGLPVGAVSKKVTEGAANNVMDEYVATPENAGMPNAVKRESRDNLILSY